MSKPARFAEAGLMAVLAAYVSVVHMHCVTIFIVLIQEHGIPVDFEPLKTQDGMRMYNSLPDSQRMQEIVVRFSTLSSACTWLQAIFDKFLHHAGPACGMCQPLRTLLAWCTWCSQVEYLAGLRLNRFKSFATARMLCCRRLSLQTLGISTAL